MQGITKLCDLYKQSKSNFLKIKSTAEEIASDAKAVKSWWQRLFATAPITPKSVAKKTEKFVDYNESQAMADIVAELTKFWTLQDKLTEYLRTEEEKAKVYDPTVTNAQQMQNAGATSGNSSAFSSFFVPGVLALIAGIRGRGDA